MNESSESDDLIYIQVITLLGIRLYSIKKWKMIIFQKMNFVYPFDSFQQSYAQLLSDFSLIPH